MLLLTMARWGVREFCIAIVAVNTASLRPRKSSLTSTLNHILPLNPEFRLVQESFPEILLETPRLSRSRPPPQPWKLPFPISAPIPPAPKQTPQPQPSPQLRIQVNLQLMHTSARNSITKTTSSKTQTTKSLRIPRKYDEQTHH